MKFLALASTLLLANTALGFDINSRKIRRRATSSSKSTDVPEYKISIPVDHFDTSNTKTYSNRFFVNDTYYKSGGPVIVYDFGEGGVGPDDASYFLAEDGAVSAPVRLAEKLNGVVVGWEHRYYGLSRPVEMDDYTGLPVSGVAGYKYLTVDQAIEDVAYFANNFNTTKLSKNHVIDSTEKLDPYHTPWIFMGGSYPGMRAAFVRLMHPEIFYASWASSAPVETQMDGSVYYNPIVRAIPQNCSNDIAAAIKYVDDTLTSGDKADIQTIYAGTFMSTGTGSWKTLDEAYIQTPFDVGENLTYGMDFGDLYQSTGATHTSQYFCDWMESFDVEAFASDAADAQSIEDGLYALFTNPGDSNPSKDGIAAANGKNGGALAFAAMLYGIVQGRDAYNNWTNTLPTSDSSSSDTSTFDTSGVDGMSWSWQTLAEVGYYQGSNASNPTKVLSKFYNVTAFRDIYVEQEMFGEFTESSLPQTINDSYILKMGGWNMKASNVMFTNGEFDPWRAFSVASEESYSGAPNRTMTTKVPACNAVVDGTDVFGIVYNGAVHAEDLAYSPGIPQGSTEDPNPLEQGMKLFLEAWAVWEPCFNQSRDDVRNGKGVDGQGHNADGKTESQEESGAGKASSLSVVAVIVGAASVMFTIM